VIIESAKQLKEGEQKGYWVWEREVRYTSARDVFWRCGEAREGEERSDERTQDRERERGRKLEKTTISKVDLDDDVVDSRKDELDLVGVDGGGVVAVDAEEGRREETRRDRVSFRVSNEVDWRARDDLSR